jgi:hypothetical protein
MAPLMNAAPSHARTLFKRLKAARLDGNYDEEMRKLHRVARIIRPCTGWKQLKPTTFTRLSWNGTGR